MKLQQKKRISAKREGGAEKDNHPWAGRARGWGRGRGNTPQKIKDAFRSPRINGNTTTVPDNEKNIHKYRRFHGRLMSNNVL